MIDNILLGFLLVLLTTVIHSWATVGVIWGLRAARVGEWVHRSGRTRFLALGSIVLFMFAATLLESALWAMSYIWSGAISDFEQALYFSMVTFTTLGYGEITLDVQWRLLSGLQAANGVVILGWTTSIIVAAVQRVYIVAVVSAEVLEKENA